LSEIGGIAHHFAESGFFRDGKTKSQAFAKILAGQELNIGPMQAMSQLHIVEGKIALDATLIRSRIKQSGKYDYKIKESSATACSIDFYERGAYVGTSSFTLDDAKHAELLGKGNWKKYPEAMLLARATSKGARTYTPDVFNGAVYVVEELTGTQEVHRVEEAVKIPQTPPAQTLKVATPIHVAEEKAPAALPPSKVEISQEVQELCREVYSLIGLKKNSPEDQKRKGNEMIAEVVRDKGAGVPKHIYEFTADELRAFIDDMKASDSEVVNDAELL